VAEQKIEKDPMLDEIRRIREKIGEIRKDLTDQELLAWYTAQAKKARERVRGTK